MADTSIGAKIYELVFYRIPSTHDSDIAIKYISKYHGQMRASSQGSPQKDSVNNMALDVSEGLAKLEKEENEKVKNREFEEGELKRCHICGKRVEHMDNHILSKHIKRVKCKLCGKSFKIDNLSRHVL